jgi:glutamate racemase
MKIGVFDSGKGGEIVAERLKKIFPHDEFIIVNDREHLPYGDKTNEEITRLTDAAIRPLLNETKIIIIACNTATAAAIATLRTRYPDTHFIGFEPAIKPAANDTKARKIMVLATPVTLKSAKYLTLKKRVAADVKVIEPDCSNWAVKIEKDEFSEADLTPIIDLAETEAVDEIVLGCTHYLAVDHILRAKLPAKVKIVEPIAAVARRLNFMLE